jgi:hypothetical protein
MDLAGLQRGVATGDRLIRGPLADRLNTSQDTACRGNLLALRHGLAGGRNPTQGDHRSGLEMRRHGGSTEEGSIGMLPWEEGQATFDSLDLAWLWTFPRCNWRMR